MTCIIGFVEKDNGIVYVGGDSAGVTGLDVCIREDPKVFLVQNKFIIGYTTSFRMGQLLHFSFNPPDQKKDQTDYEYMCTNFINEAMKCFDAGKFGPEHEKEKRGGSFLVGYKGNLYHIESDFQVGILKDPFWSVGCGAHFALGALYATSGLKMPTEKRITLALQTAVKFSGGVRPPFVILHLP